jgi:peptide deformylase
MSPASPKPFGIVLYPDPILKKRARELTPEELRIGQADGRELRQLVARMFVAMQAADGAGLAAPQVGVNLRLFVAHPDAKTRAPFAVLNPVLSEMAGAVVQEEGCLSLPGVRGKVKRAERLVLTGCDEKGQPLRIAADGLEARIFQHECDHLDGVLLLQRLGTAQRFMLRHQIRVLEDEYESRQLRRRKARAAAPVMKR